MLNNENTENGRILALDVGKKRIGLAVSDALGITSQGLPTLKRTTLRADIAELDRIAAEQEAVLVLVGHPLNMDGTESRQSIYTREFAAKFAARTGRAVHLRDERMTSMEAEDVLRQSGVGHGKRAKAVDKMAAQLILRNYLNARESMERFGVALEQWEQDPDAGEPESDEAAPDSASRGTDPVKTETA